MTTWETIEFPLLAHLTKVEMSLWNSEFCRLVVVVAVVIIGIYGMVSQLSIPVYNNNNNLFCISHLHIQSCLQRLRCLMCSNTGRTWLIRTRLIQSST